MRSELFRHPVAKIAIGFSSLTPCIQYVTLVNYLVQRIEYMDVCLLMTAIVFIIFCNARLPQHDEFFMLKMSGGEVNDVVEE